MIDACTLARAISHSRMPRATILTMFINNDRRCVAATVLLAALETPHGRGTTRPLLPRAGRSSGIIARVRRDRTDRGERSTSGKLPRALLRRNRARIPFQSRAEILSDFNNFDIRVSHDRTYADIPLFVNLLISTIIDQRSSGFSHVDLWRLITRAMNRRKSNCHV